MKHQRSQEDEEAQESSSTGTSQGGTPSTLCGPDQREKKRPRTASLDSLIENDGSAINTKNYYPGLGAPAPVSVSGSSFPTPELNAEESTPRLLALISSLENAAGNNDKGFEALTPSAYSAAMQSQSQVDGSFSAPPFRPLTARPPVHTIVERPLMAEAAAAAAAGFGASSASIAPAPAVAAAVVQRLQQQKEMMQLASLVANATNKAPSSLASAPLTAASSSSLTNGATAAAALYSSFAFSQQQQLLAQRRAAVSAAAAAMTGSSSFPTRPQAIRSGAVPTDYKKTFRPLQRPPRLPTANEAMSVVPTWKSNVPSGNRAAITVNGQCYR